MKKTIVLSFISIIFITGCFQSESESTEFQDGHELPIPLESMNEDVEEIIRFAPVRFDDSQKPALFEALAKEPDLSNCDLITDEFLNSVCVRNVATDLAINNRDTSYCENITEEVDKDKCISKVENLSLPPSN